MLIVSAAQPDEVTAIMVTMDNRIFFMVESPKFTCSAISLNEKSEINASASELSLIIKTDLCLSRDGLMTFLSLGHTGNNPLPHTHKKGHSSVSF